MYTKQIEDVKDREAFKRGCAEISDKLKVSFDGYVACVTYWEGFNVDLERKSSDLKRFKAFINEYRLAQFNKTVTA